MTPVARMLDESSLVLCVGPGGVGKTTVAAALAVGAARTGRRVAVVTADPARRLARTLSIDAGSGPQPVAGVAGLVAEAFDPGTAWDDLVRRETGDGATRLVENSMYQAVTRRFVQSHDFISVERVHALLDMDFDLVIVDTPPLGRGVDFLDSPERMAAFFTARSLGWFTGTASGPLGELTAKPFRLIAGRVLGGRFVADLIEFFALLKQLGGGFVERAEAVGSRLRDVDTAAVVVTTAEALPLGSAFDLRGALDARSIRCAGTVVNRVLPLVDLPDRARLMDELAEQPEPSDPQADAAAFVERSLVALVKERHDAELQRELIAAAGMDPWQILELRDRSVDDVVSLESLAAELLDGPD